jgi:hypothetical protein
MGCAGLLNIVIVSFFELGTTVSVASTHGGHSFGRSMFVGRLANALFLFALIPLSGRDLIILRGRRRLYQFN